MMEAVIPSKVGMSLRTLKKIKEAKEAQRKKEAKEAQTKKEKKREGTMLLSFFHTCASK